MNPAESAQRSIKHGAEFPFDAPDSWWNVDMVNAAPPAKNWAHVAARGIIADLEDRRGIKHELENIEERVRVEIVEALSEIVRQAHNAYSVGNGGKTS